MIRDSHDLDELKKEWLRNKDQYKEKFCRMLFKTGLIRFIITKTKTEDIAPYFVKLDLLVSFPKEFQQTLAILLKIVKLEVGLEKLTRIAATTTHVLPYAAVLTHTLEVPMLFIETRKTGGRKRRIDGILYPGDKVLIVDDVVSTGETAKSAADKLRSEGALVEDFAALLDNERGGRERLKSEGINLHAFITISEVADYLEKMSLITTDEHRIIYGWVKRKHAS